MAVEDRFTGEELTRRRALIAEHAEVHYGLIPKEEEWRIADDGDVVAVLPGWEVSGDHEDEGLYDGDLGDIHICVVGAPAHGNEQVAYYWKGEDHEDVSARVVPFENVQPLP